MFTRWCWQNAGVPRMLNKIITFRNQKGVSIPEIMIGSLVGLIILSGVLTIYTSTVKGSADTLKSAKLNQELNAAIGIMVRDVRRAGYWGAATVNNTTNPFAISTGATPTNLDIKATNGPCVLYTYDRDASGAVNVEYYGFRVNNGAVEMRTGTGTKTNDCTDGTWQAITDTDIITISALTFTTENSKCLNSTANTSWVITTTGSTSYPCRDSAGTGYAAPASGDVLIETRQVTIKLDGELANDSLVTKSLEESIRVRNDRVTVVP